MESEVSYSSSEEYHFTIKEIRETWEGYDENYCYSCFYNAINYARKNDGFCDLYTITPHIDDCSDYTELFVDAGKDVKILTDVLDGISREDIEEIKKNGKVTTKYIAVVFMID